MTGGAEGGDCSVVSVTGVPALSDPLTLLREDIADEEEDDEEEGGGRKDSRGGGHSPESSPSLGRVKLRPLVLGAGLLYTVICMSPERSSSLLRMVLSRTDSFLISSLLASPRV